MSNIIKSFSTYADLVFVLPFDQRSERFLAIHRSDDHTWGLLGGKSNEGEAAVDAIEREAFEEAKIRLLKPMPSYEFSPKKGLCCIVFVAVVNPDIPLKLNGESLEARWVNIDKWPQPAHPQMQHVLNENSNGFLRDARRLYKI